MYESLILVDPDVTITAEQLAAELRRFYQGKAGAPAEIAHAGQDVRLRWPGYLLEVGRSSVPHVLIESQELALKFAREHPARDRIASCTCRFEVSGDDDPDMEHFNDSLYVGEALSRLGSVYRFEQASCEFLD
jgi:hypothetical protein